MASLFLWSAIQYSVFLGCTIFLILISRTFTIMLWKTSRIFPISLWRLIARTCAVSFLEEFLFNYLGPRYISGLFCAFVFGLLHALTPLHFVASMAFSISQQVLILESFSAAWLVHATLTLTTLAFIRTRAAWRFLLVVRRQLPVHLERCIWWKA
jgi:hypothetical protein